MPGTLLLGQKLLSPPAFPSFPRTPPVKGPSSTSYTFQDICPEVLEAMSVHCPLQHMPKPSLLGMGRDNTLSVPD